MRDALRYKTLRDYLRVVRRYRVLIVLAAVVFAAAGYLLSARQPKTYRAEASLSFTDPSIDLGLTGDQVPLRRTAERESAIGAEYVTEPLVAKRVKASLRTDRSASSLRSSVSAAPDTQTNLVIVQATDKNPRNAAIIANAFARQTEIVRTRADRVHFDKAALSQRERFDKLKVARSTPIIRAAFEERISRLESLADFADPVQVVRSAEVPSAPISPRPVRTALLAGLLGLTLGIIAAFVRDALDPRLRTTGDVQSELRLPLLANLSSKGLSRIGTARNGRGPAPQHDVEAIRILRRNLEFLSGEQPMRSIAITSAVAGEGKSTVAASLAWAQVYSGKRALLMDCDLRRGGLARRLDRPPAPGLTDYLSGKARFEEVLQQMDAQDGALFADEAGDSPLAFIAAGSPTDRPTELLESPNFHQLLDVIMRSYDPVIIDTSPLLPVADPLKILTVVDTVVLCVRAGVTTRDQALSARAALERMPSRPTGVVITGVRPGEYTDYGYEPLSGVAAVKS